MKPTITVAYGGNHPARVEKTVDWVWEDFVKSLTANVPELEDKAAAGWFCCGTFENSYRDSENLISRSALTFDYDVITWDDLNRIKVAFSGYEYLQYSTASYTPEKPRVRVIMPLSRPATADEFCAISRKIASECDIEIAARESHVPAQMTFLPTVKPGMRIRARANPGSWVDVDAVLASYADWTDRKQWPTRKDGDSTYKSNELPADPRTKPGIIGLWCRTFSVPEAISRFELPYEPVR